ncbi:MULTISPECIES: hypothetical protein [Thauera]|uniref:Uncharacterized protein n=1 Tax=Thauera aromatica K172 TaxID=44139 RepID=A0A2R4BM70_THAAR|nr:MULTISPECIES: hypothetical protein [Thauera]AVR88342.1 hypothetical protein Tharo_1417 [Thauera aromatica K172]KIN91650.1 hypothetical protein PO78_3794 [Thauera sp. SWB20]
MSPEHLSALIAEIEAETPLDFSAAAIDAQYARRLMASHFCEIDARLAACGLLLEDRLEMMAAIAAHALVENMLLQLVQLRAVAALHERAKVRGGEPQGAGAEGGSAAGADGAVDAAFREWMRRHGIG